jgi:hypothetical protein
MTTTTTDAPAQVSDGKKVFFVGHSFHMFIVRPLIALAKEAGIKGHWAEGWDMIGGSTPMQHWERNGDDNAVKLALKTGKVEVLTLASNVVMPEPAIDLFADMAVEHNPNVQVMLQHSWGDATTSAIMAGRHAVATGRNVEPGTNEDRDGVTAEQLAAYREGNQSYREKMRGQINGINERHGRELAHIVPVNEAVLRLREAVVAGELPGVTRQSELFRDALGHATQPTMDVVAYAWFAALYHRDPIGMTALVNPEDSASLEQQPLLQRIAWECVLDEPLSGVTSA